METTEQISYAVEHKSVASASSPCCDIEALGKIKRMMGAATSVRAQKKQEVDEARKEWKCRCNPRNIDGDLWLVGGDILTSLFLVFEAIRNFAPVLSTSAAINVLSSIFGFAGGLINLVVGGTCICQGIKELSKNHKVDGVRLIFDGFLMIFLGLVMIATPILIKLGIVGTFVTNPFFLATLFLLLSVFIFCEILVKLNCHYGDNFTKQLQAINLSVLDTQSAISEEEEKWVILAEITNLLFQQVFSQKEDDTTSLVSMQRVADDEKELAQLCIDRFNQVEEKVGLEAAIQIHQVFTGLIDLAIALEAEKFLRDNAFSERTTLQTLEEESQAQGVLLDWLLKGQEDSVILAINDLKQEKQKVTSGYVSQILERTSCKENAGEICCILNRKVVLDQAISVARAIDPHHCSNKSVLKLASELQNSRQITEDLKSFEKDYREYRRIQWIRFTQQVLFIFASVMGFVTLFLNNTLICRMMNGCLSIAMIGGNAIPTYLDACVPYQRNTKLVLPTLDPSEVLVYLQGASPVVA